MSKPAKKGAVLGQFPYALSLDKEIYALADASADEITALFDTLPLLTIYNRIDSLDETLCDILAYDFKIDWYDHDATLTEKRDTIKNHFIVHKILGTPKALDLAFKPFFENARAENWNTYGGKPYHFRLIIDTEMPDYDKLLSLIKMMRYFSNVRSRLEMIGFNVEKRAKPKYVGTVIHGQEKLTATLTPPPNYPKVGGKIFYIDNSASGATYTFYDENGTEIHSVDVGDEPYMYTVTGTPTADKYYIVNEDYEECASWTYKDSDEQWVYNTVGTSYGTGKANTATVNAADNGAYKNYTGTVWNTLYSMNAAEEKGCNDWYVPSKTELENMYLADITGIFTRTNFFISSSEGESASNYVVFNSRYYRPSEDLVSSKDSGGKLVAIRSI